MAMGTESKVHRAACQCYVKSAGPWLWHSCIGLQLGCSATAALVIALGNTGGTNPTEKLWWSQVKVAAVAAIGAWLPTAKQLPAPVLKHFETGLKDREALKRANLRCLAKVKAFTIASLHHVPCLEQDMFALLEPQAKSSNPTHSFEDSEWLVQALQVSPTLAESTAPLAKPLGQLVTDGVAKVAVRSDGVVALYALAVLAAHSPAAAAQCKQDKVRGPTCVRRSNCSFSPNCQWFVRGSTSWPYMQVSPCCDGLRSSSGTCTVPFDALLNIANSHELAIAGVEGRSCRQQPTADVRCCGSSGRP